jgi:hypothetical protein
MSQKTANWRQATGDRRQATGDRRQATGDRRQATGYYTHLLNNRVNKPIAYITSLFGISLQSANFYSRYFLKTSPVPIQKSFSQNKKR